MEVNPRESLLSAARFAFWIFLVLTLAFVVFIVWSHGRLPDRIPVHFDFEGEVNRRASKSEFLVVNLGVAALLFVCFGMFALFVGRIPNRYFNLPHRDYWLAPERRSQSIARFNAWYLWMGILSLGLMFHLAWQVYEIGMGKTERLESGWIALTVYLSGLTLLCLGLWRAFAKKPTEDYSGHR